MYKPVRKRGDNAARLDVLNYMLDANRNLLLSLAVVFSAEIFAAAADGLDFRNRPGESVTGVLSGIVVGIMSIFILVVALVHAFMVYQYGKLVGSRSIAWFLIPVGVVFVGWIPMIAYLILLYT